MDQAEAELMDLDPQIFHQASKDYAGRLSSRPLKTHCGIRLQLCCSTI